jgi:hypothetical protein
MAGVGRAKHAAEGLMDFLPVLDRPLKLLGPAESSDSGGGEEQGELEPK